MLSHVLFNLKKSIKNTGHMEMKEKLDKCPEDIL